MSEHLRLEDVIDYDEQMTVTITELSARPYFLILGLAWMDIQLSNSKFFTRGQDRIWNLRAYEVGGHTSLISQWNWVAASPASFNPAKTFTFKANRAFHSASGGWADDSATLPAALRSR